MKDLCWLKGGPLDGKVVEAEMAAYLEFPQYDENFITTWIKYQPFRYSPDGVLCRWVP